MLLYPTSPPTDFISGNSNGSITGIDAAFIIGLPNQPADVLIANYLTGGVTSLNSAIALPGQGADVASTDNINVNQTEITDNASFRGIGGQANVVTPNSSDAVDKQIGNGMAVTVERNGYSTTAMLKSYWLPADAAGPQDIHLARGVAVRIVEVQVPNKVRTRYKPELGQPMPEAAGGNAAR